MDHLGHVKSPISDNFAKPLKTDRSGPEKLKNSVSTISCIKQKIHFSGGNQIRYSVQLHQMDLSITFEIPWIFLFWFCNGLKCALHKHWGRPYVQHCRMWSRLAWLEEFSAVWYRYRVVAQVQSYQKNLVWTLRNIFLPCHGRSLVCKTNPFWTHVWISM